MKLLQKKIRIFSLYILCTFFSPALSPTVIALVFDIVYFCPPRDCFLMLPLQCRVNVYAPPPRVDHFLCIDYVREGTQNNISKLTTGNSRFAFDSATLVFASLPVELL